MKSQIFLMIHIATYVVLCDQSKVNVIVITIFKGDSWRAQLTSGRIRTTLANSAEDVRNTHILTFNCCFILLVTPSILITYLSLVFDCAILIVFKSSGLRAQSLTKQ